jgi:hypothetical protein
MLAVVALPAGCTISFGGSSSLVELGTVTRSESLAAEIHAISVVNNVGQIRVVCDRPDNVLAISGTVRIKRGRRDEFAAADPERDLRIETVGGVVMVKNAHLDQSDHNDWGLDLDVRVPHSLDVTVQNAVGDVDVFGDPSGVTISLGPGGINLKVGVVTGEVRLDGSSGDISLVADEIRDRVSIDLGVGNAKVQLLSGFPKEGVSVQLGTGDVRLVLPANTAAHAELEVATGGLDVAEAFGLDTHGHLVGESASGPLTDDGPLLSVQVGVGEITLTTPGR